MNFCFLCCLRVYVCTCCPLANKDYKASSSSVNNYRSGKKELNNNLIHIKTKKWLLTMSFLRAVGMGLRSWGKSIDAMGTSLQGSAVYVEKRTFKISPKIIIFCLVQKPKQYIHHNPIKLTITFLFFFFFKLYKQTKHNQSHICSGTFCPCCSAQWQTPNRCS